LLEWLANNREKAYAHRREHYRLVALDLARRYSTLLLDDTDFRALQRHPGFGAARLPPAVRRNRALTACGELRATLQYMAEKRGCRTVLVPARALAKTCHACGHACGTARIDRVEHTCVHCGARWDVDENVARNLLARGEPTLCVETIGLVTAPRAALSRA
jgi:transposase